MSLLLNMLSRLLITFLPRSKHLLVSWLQSPSAVIWEPKKIKSFNRVRLLATPWTAAHQRPPSMGFSKVGEDMKKRESLHTANIF